MSLFSFQNPLTSSLQASITKKRSRVGELFKRKLSWGGKQGSQAINSSNSKRVTEDSISIKEDRDSTDVDTTDTQLATQGDTTHVEDESDSEHYPMKLDGVYPYETDVEDAFTTPHASVKVRHEEPLNNDSQQEAPSQSNSIQIPRKKRRKKGRKNMEIDPIKENTEEEEPKEATDVKETPSTNENSTSKETLPLKNPTPSKEDSFAEERPIKVVEKRSKMFSRTSIFKIFKTKKKDSHASIQPVFETVTEEPNFDTRKPSEEVVIAQEIDEVEAHCQFKETIKAYIHQGKEFVKQMKFLNEQYFVPATKKYIGELTAISHDFQNFVQKYVLYLKQAEKKYKDDDWTYGHFFCTLHQFCDTEFHSFRNHQVEIFRGLKKETKDEMSSLKLFLQSVKVKKELSFEELLLHPMHHLQAILHCTTRLSTLTLSTHPEFREINDAARSFEKLNVDLSAIESQNLKNFYVVKDIADSIQFSKNVPRLVLNDGKRKLICEANFKLFQEEGSIFKYFTVHGFLFNDIIIICKPIEPLEESSQDQEEDNEVVVADSHNKKYSALAVIPIRSIFIVDPVEGLDGDATKPEKIDLKLEIVETGATIHRLLFSSIAEKELWKSNLNYEIRNSMFTYSVLNQYKHYKYLLTHTNVEKLTQVEWPHSFSLRSLQDKEMLFVPYRNPASSEYEELRTELQSLNEKVSDQLTFAPKGSSTPNDKRNTEDTQSLEDIKALCLKLSASLEAETKSRMDLETKLADVSQKYLSVHQELESIQEKQDKMIEDYELRFIKLRESYEKDLENIMCFVESQKLIGTNPSPSDKSRKRQKSRHMGENQICADDKSSPRDRSLSTSQGVIEDSESSSKNDRSGSFQSSHPNLSALQTSNNSQSDTPSSGKKVRKLKNTRFNQEEPQPTNWKSLKKFALGPKKEKNQKHWRKTPDAVQPNDGKPLYVKKSKKIEWSTVKNENYYSDDFTSDYEGYYSRNFIVHSDYTKNDYVGEVAYTSECSDDEMSKPHVTRGMSTPRLNQVK